MGLFSGIMADYTGHNEYGIGGLGTLSMGPTGFASPGVSGIMNDLGGLTGFMVASGFTSFGGNGSTVGYRPVDVLLDADEFVLEQGGEIVDTDLPLPDSPGAGVSIDLPDFAGTRTIFYESPQNWSVFDAPINVPDIDTSDWLIL